MTQIDSNKEYKIFYSFIPGKGKITLSEAINNMRDFMKRYLLIDNFSNIELFYLKEAAQKILTRTEQQAQNGVFAGQGYSAIDWKEEIAFKFLEDCYGFTAIDCAFLFSGATHERQKNKFQARANMRLSLEYLRHSAYGLHLDDQPREFSRYFKNKYSTPEL